MLNHTMPNRHFRRYWVIWVQSDALYEALSGQENLEFWSAKRAIQRDLTAEIAHVAQVVDLI